MSFWGVFHGLTIVSCTLKPLRNWKPKQFYRLVNSITPSLKSSDACDQVEARITRELDLITLWMRGVGSLLLVPASYYLKVGEHSLQSFRTPREHEAKRLGPCLSAIWKLELLCGKRDYCSNLSFEKKFLESSQSRGPCHFASQFSVIQAFRQRFDQGALDFLGIRHKG